MDKTQWQHRNQTRPKINTQTIPDTLRRPSLQTEAISQSERISNEAEARTKASRTSTINVKQPAPTHVPLKPETRQNRPVRRVRRKGYALISALLLLFLLGTAGIVVWTHMPPPSVTAFHVGAQQRVSQDIGGGGIIYPHQQFNLSYPAGERVTNVEVKAGDVVKPNQPLLQLDQTQVHAELNQASSDVAAAQAYLNTVSATGNPVTIAQAQQSLQVAQSHYNSLTAGEQSPIFHDGTLISPISGVVTSINIDPGEVFAANTTLLTLMDLSTVTVRAKIPLSNLSQVHIGMPAQVTPSALPDLTMQGTVTSVIPQADPQTDTFEVWVEIAHPQQAILPGGSAFVRVESPVSAYVVPRISVLDPDHESVVFVVRHGVASMQHVHVIGRSTDSVYVDSGLQRGDVIVVRPLDTLHDGQKVTVTHIGQ